MRYEVYYYLSLKCRRGGESDKKQIRDVVVKATTSPKTVGLVIHDI